MATITVEAAMSTAPIAADRHPTRMEHEQHRHAPHTAGTHPTARGHHAPEHHGHMVADFRRRFWVSLVLTVPVVLLSPMLQDWFGLQACPSAGGRLVAGWNSPPANRHNGYIRTTCAAAQPGISGDVAPGIQGPVPSSGLAHNRRRARAVP